MECGKSDLNMLNSDSQGPSMG